MDQQPPVDLATLRGLYTTPPAEFITARNQLVKARKAAKDRDAAAALGKLRKPALADWALNVVATEHADDVAGFLDAAGAVRDAQAAAIAGRDGPDIRTALQGLRERSGRVLGRAQEVLVGAGRDAGAEAGTVAARLTEIAANDEASRQFGAGVLGSAGVGVTELFADLEPAARPAPRRAGKRAPTSAPAKAAKPRKAAGDVGPALKELKHALTQATRARDTATRDQARADAAADKAAAAVRNAERQLDRARDALAAAEQDRDEAAQRLGHAEGEVESARQALDRVAR